MGRRQQVVDDVEVAVGLGLVGQEVEGPQVAVDVHTGHDMALADHRALALTPLLEIPHLDAEGIEPLVAADTDEEIDERQTIALAATEGIDGVVGGGQGVGEVEIAEDETDDLGDPVFLFAPRVEPHRGQLLDLRVELERHLETIGVDFGSDLGQPLGVALADVGRRVECLVFGAGQAADGQEAGGDGVATSSRPAR